MSDRLEEVRPGIVWVGMRTVEGKAGVVAGSRAVLAIDAGIDLDEGRAVASAARSFDRESILLALTHAHTDHALGSPAFASQTVIVHNEAAEALRLILPADVAGWPPDLGGADMLGPTIWFSGDLEIDLGGRVVRLLDAPGHAPGAICAWVPDAGVLFGGDTIVTCIPPSFSDGDAVELAATLRTLASLGADVVVPGHGPVLTGVARISDLAAGCRRLHRAAHRVGAKRPRRPVGRYRPGALRIVSRPSSARDSRTRGTSSREHPMYTTASRRCGAGVMTTRRSERRGSARD